MQSPPAEKPESAGGRSEHGLLAAISAIAVVAVVVAWFAMRVAATETLERDAAEQAQAWATFISSDIEDFDSFVAGGSATVTDYRLLNTAQKFGNVFSYKIYRADGTVTQASNPGDLGLVKSTAYFRNIVAAGQPFTRMGKGGFDDVPDIYVEAYVPIMRGGRFVGAVETYVDVTELAADIRRKSAIALIGLIAIIALFGAALTVVYMRHARRQKTFLMDVSESEKRYRSLLDVLPDGVRINRDGRVLYANHAEAELLGAASMESLIGQPSNFTEAHEQDKIRERQQAIDSGEPVGWRETTRVRLDGGIVPVESIMFPISWDGDYARLLVTRDISEKVEANRKLAESQTRYQRLIEASPDAIRVHVDGVIVFANTAAARLLGAADPSELIGVESTRFNLEEDTAFIQERRDLMNAGRPNEWAESRRIRMDGSIVDVESAAMPIDWDGNTGHLVINRDISARKEAEQMNTRLGRIVDESSNEVYVFDAATLQYTQVNRGTCENLGYDADELMRMTAIDLTPEFDRQRFEELVAPLRTGDVGSLKYETQHVRKDGTLYDVAVNLQLMQNEKPPQFAAIVQDITERKQFEFSLKIAKDEAENAARDAETANRAKSEFLATMSHEIRTPMNGIQGMARLLLDSGLSQEQRDQAEIIATSGDALLTIINDILDFSKLEAGKLELEDVEISLSQTVEGVVELIDTQASDKGLQLAAYIDPRLMGKVYGDSGRLRQVLLNLASNAVKFTNEGGVTLTAEVTAETDETLSVRMEVRDTGIGLSAEAQSRLFEKFVQADASTTRRFGGTGLGLAICKQIAELMGGTIGVESEEGVGSTFRVDLDFRRGKEPDITVDAGPSPDRVLLAVRDATARAIAARQIEAFGYDVAAVGDMDGLQHALQSAGREDAPFGTVLVDQEIDGASGGIACGKIEATPCCEDSRVVLITNRGLAGEAARRANPDIGRFIAKPLRPSRLLSALSQEQDAPAGNEADTGERPDRQEKTAGLKILLAEDNYVNQQVAIAMLSKGGHQIDIANDGIEALMMASRTQYDIILMDVQMPNMSGVDATRKIRRLPGPAARTPIVALTANAMVGNREAYLEAGMDDYVSKPIDPGLLSAVLTRQSGQSAVAGTTKPTAEYGDAPAEVSETDVGDMLDSLDALFEDD